MRMVSLRRTRVSAELPGERTGTDSATLLPVVTALVRVLSPVETSKSRSRRFPVAVVRPEGEVEISLA